MLSKYYPTLTTAMFTLLLWKSGGETKSDVNVDVTVDVDGKEVIHATHPRESKQRVINTKPPGT